MELDVIVFESGDRRFALELKYVQEVLTLGHVTPVPLAPPAIRGRPCTWFSATVQDSTSRYPFDM